MKLLASMDSDGHFMIAHPSDRKVVLNLLHKISDGDYLADITNDYEFKFKQDLDEYCCQEWDKMVGYFIQRGTLEYVEIPDTIPVACKCD